MTTHRRSGGRALAGLVAALAISTALVPRLTQLRDVKALWRNRENVSWPGRGDRVTIAKSIPQDFGSLLARKAASAYREASKPRHAWVDALTISVTPSGDLYKVHVWRPFKSEEPSSGSPLGSESLIFTYDRQSRRVGPVIIQG